MANPAAEGAPRPDQLQQLDNFSLVNDYLDVANRVEPGAYGDPHGAISMLLEDYVPLPDNPEDHCEGDETPRREPDPEDVEGLKMFAGEIGRRIAARFGLSPDNSGGTNGE